MQNLDQQKDSIPSFGLVSHKYQATDQIVKDNGSTRPFTVSADRPVDDIALGCCRTHTHKKKAAKSEKYLEESEKFLRCEGCAAFYWQKLKCLL